MNFTLDDVELCPVDLISDAISDGDLLTANVMDWEQPTMSEQYVKVCQTFHTPENKKVSSAFASCEDSGKLLLDDFCLGEEQLQPIFSVLENKSKITELSLAGNRIGNSGFKLLCDALKGLSNLISLNLASNLHITRSH